MWYLVLLFISTSTGMHSMYVPFNSEEACVEAKHIVMTELKPGIGDRYQAVCVRKY